MNKNFTLKCIALFAFTLLGFKAQAQYYVNYTETTKSLKVDTTDGEDGTTGSWYKWTVDNGAASESVPSTNAPTESINKDSNKATITWKATWPIAGGDPLELIKDYKITAEEFNSCQPSISTEDSKTDINVKLVKPDVLFIDADSDVCSTAKANITFYGTPGAVVNYIINGGTVSDGGSDTSATFDIDGKIDLEISSNGTTDVELEISDVEFTSPQNSELKFKSTTITATAGKTITIPLSAGPVISEITFDE